MQYNKIRYFTSTDLKNLAINVYSIEELHNFFRDPQSSFTLRVNFKFSVKVIQIKNTPNGRRTRHS